MARWRRAESPDRGPTLAEVLDTGRVRAVLALGGVPWDELDDGVQQVRLKLIEEETKRGRHQIREPAAWASVVASRVAIDWHRARSRDAGLRERLAGRWERHPPAPHSEDEALLAMTVAQGLDALPSAQRQILVLRFYADLTVRDMAEHLDIPEGTVKSRLHAAVNAVRERLRAMEVL